MVSKALFITVSCKHLRRMAIRVTKLTPLVIMGMRANRYPFINGRLTILPRDQNPKMDHCNPNRSEFHHLFERLYVDFTDK